MSKRRPSGDGMVRKKDDGRWEGRIVVGHKNNGDSIFRYIYGATQKELMQKLHQEINAYQGVDLTEDCKMALSEWLDRWLDEYMAESVRPSTLQGYRRYADHYIKPLLGEKQISKITSEDVQTMYGHLKAKGRLREHPQYGHQLSDTTIRSIHSMFHLAMSKAEEEHLIAKNPTAGVAVPKPAPPPMQVLTDAELDIFLAAIQEDSVWYDFFYTELTTGLRRGEICGLMWQDFDAKNGVLHVRRTVHACKGGGLVTGETKTRNGKRDITLPASTAQLLRERKQGSYSQWIFPDPLRPERPTRPNGAYTHMKTLLKKAGLPNIRFHDLRHTFATHALASGVDAKTLSGILGHSKASFTLDTYTHVTGDMQKRAAEIVGDFMTDILGKELKPWQENEKLVLEASA
jgi:integrase